MGVPVITTLGDHHAARVSASLLRAAGHPEFIGQDMQDFVRVASRLASDASRLASLRSGLRAELLQSPLLDATAYASRLHAALRNLFGTACMSTHGDPRHA